MDFHNHVMPGVDDGARDLEEGVAALAGFRLEGVETVVATPHFRGSLTERPDVLIERLAWMDEAFEGLVAEAERRGVDVRLERGAEVRLDSPDVDLADSRLRLAGTHFVLVEFATFQMPAYGGEQLAGLREAGWIPVLAHPERYAGVANRLDVAERWRQEAFFQMNAGSLRGRYGPSARQAARAFLERGWIDYLSSDYHARGAPGLRETRDLLLEAEGIDPSEAEDGGTGPDEWEVAGGDEELEEPGLPVARLLTELNPRRLLANREPISVPPLELAGGLVERLRGWLR